MLNFHWLLESEAVTDERSGSLDAGTLWYSSSGRGHWPLTEAHLISYPEERRYSQKLFFAVELLCILLCTNFGIQAFIFHHTREPRFLYVEKGQLVIRSSSFSTRASFSLY